MLIKVKFIATNYSPLNAYIINVRYLYTYNSLLQITKPAIYNV